MATQADLNLLAVMLAEFNAVPSSKVPNELVIRPGMTYKRIIKKPHPDVLRAANFLAASHKKREGFRKAHSDMHIVMEQKKSNVRTAAHEQAHLDMALAGIQCEIATALLTMETHRRHPELAGQSPVFGKDGSLGWAKIHRSDDQHFPLIFVSDGSGLAELLSQIERQA